jgi:hypothetical protein
MKADLREMTSPNGMLRMLLKSRAKTKDKNKTAINIGTRTIMTDLLLSKIVSELAIKYPKKNATMKWAMNIPKIKSLP